jgi:hypothetical protein
MYHGALYRFHDFMTHSRFEDIIQTLGNAMQKPNTTNVSTKLERCLIFAIKLWQFFLSKLHQVLG